MDIQGTTSWEFAMVQSMVSLLLLIVTLNVAILIYARTATRQGEIAVRTALGASRGRLVTQLFVEALVLCGVSAFAGVMLARVGLRMGHAITETEVGRLPFVTRRAVVRMRVCRAATCDRRVIAGIVRCSHRRAWKRR